MVVDRKLGAVQVDGDPLERIGAADAGLDGTA
jgi:hypothetical protein